MHSYDDISILIVLYNSTDVIFECLEKIKKFKIIIVDNSADKKLKKK